MLKEFIINLQLFGEGGDGGDGGAATSTGEALGADSGEDLVSASIPEKAKKYYEKAMKKQSAVKAETSAQEPKEDTTSKTEEKLSYQDLIKSDEYKADHKAYMDKTIGERLKKYKGMESDLGSAREILEIVASKYGISPTDENFLTVLKEKASADDSYYEQYALDHDISAEEARRIVTMEKKVAKYDEEVKMREREAQAQAQVQMLITNAEKTKAQFPNFDLDAEMQDEKFRRLCYTNNGDTTAAYMACHWNEILPATVQRASQQVKQQTVNSIVSGQMRPTENGTNAVASSVVTQNFKNMSLSELRAQAAAWRRQGR